MSERPTCPDCGAALPGSPATASARAACCVPGSGATPGATRNCSPPTTGPAGSWTEIPPECPNRPHPKPRKRPGPPSQESDSRQNRRPRNTDRKATSPLSRALASQPSRRIHRGPDHRRTVFAAGSPRRRRHGHRLHGRADRAGPAQVALKLIKPGMDSRAGAGRFDAERQALALMDHPNIARVLDGGATDAGRPFFVMELVKGVPITDYCDRHRLTPRERLELFVPVCQAVQHAHQKGIIHRDIKPSQRPGRRVRRTARAQGHRLRRRQGDRRASSPSRRSTPASAQIVGTPQYMTPGAGRRSTTWTSTPAPTSTRWACCSTSC